MQFAEEPSARARAAVTDIRPVPFWLDSPVRPDPQPALVGDIDADLVVVGAGFTGLWTAFLAQQSDPGRRVVVLEGGRIAEGATGRNGGFVAASLTHGLANGVARFADELPTLLRLGRENLDAIESTIRELGIDCGFERSGELDVAVTDHQVSDLHDVARMAREYGEGLEFLDADATRALVDSPTYRAGLLARTGVALVDPARLAWGLAKAVRERGVTLHEGTPVVKGVKYIITKWFRERPGG